MSGPRSIAVSCNIGEEHTILKDFRGRKESLDHVPLRVGNRISLAKTLD